MEEDRNKQRKRKRQSYKRIGMKEVPKEQLYNPKQFLLWKLKNTINSKRYHGYLLIILYKPVKNIYIIYHPVTASNAFTAFSHLDHIMNLCETYF